MTHVLLTRPQAHNDTLKPLVESLGLSVVSAPLLRILYYDMLPSWPFLRQGEPQAYLFTSVHGVYALSRHHTPPAPAPPSLCMGPASGDAARVRGFEPVLVGDGRKITMLALAHRYFRPAAGYLYHSCGSVVADSVISQLRTDGYDIQQDALYHAKAAKTLPEDAKRLLQKGAITYALFFSQRTAAIFLSIMATLKATGESPQLNTTTALALNKATATTLRRLPFKSVHTARLPTQQAMLNKLQQLRT
ncbi:MAG: uroporphyrinogen-III synthase [Alphaproteobacteria bacterium GM202ARS2]|nr:uroporphyrinogen-III synthase [Alphaproteobacteria bacterium GM202ARS2]